MIRGTTPTFKLLINDETLDLTQASGVYASFEQGTTEILKTGNDLTISCTHGDTGNVNEVDVFLSQSETLSFKVGEILCQLNWTYANGERACTNIIRIKVGNNLIESVIE